MLKEDLENIQLLLLKKPHFVFFNSLIYKFKFSEMSEGTIKYNTNKEIFINPKWFSNLSNQEKLTSIAHQILHYALQHDIRGRGSNPNKWQQASDITVNCMLKDMGFELPQGEPYFPEYSNKSVEEVYSLLPEPEEQNQSNSNLSMSSNNIGNSGEDDDDSEGSEGKSQPDNPLGNDIPKDSEDNSSERFIEASEAKMSDDLAASSSSKSYALNGNEFKQFFKICSPNKINWRAKLQQYASDLSKDDRSYAKLDRRMLAFDLYLPDMVTDNNIEKITVAVDVSGSVTKQELESFLNEIRKIKEIYNPENLEIITFNHKVVANINCSQETKLDNINLYIGGGTNLVPVFNHIKYSKKDPKFLIVFSDLVCNTDISKPSYPVIWVVVNNPKGKVKFGNHIHINSKDLL